MAGITPAQGRELLESSHMSDFLITCQGREIKTHRVILASVYGFFKVLFKHDFKENIEAKVDFPDDDPDTIYRVCEFIYVGSYSVDTEGTPEPSRPQSISPDGKKTVKKPQDSKAIDAVYNGSAQRAHAMVYCCANKHDISVLKDNAYCRFVQGTHPTKFNWDAGLLTLVYENTDRDDAGLRSYVTRRCIDHYVSVLKDEKLVAVLNEHEPFIWKLGRDLKVQARDYAKKLEKATSGVQALELSLKAEKEKNAMLQQDLDKTKTKAATDLVEAKKKTEAAKAEITGEVAYSTKMFEHLRGAKHCEHCGKGDKMATPVRQWNDEVGREQYLLRCDSCGWWWWFKRD